MIRRREFMTLLGGAAVAWPVAARAQQQAMPVIGFFHLTSLETRRDYLAAFRRGLGEIGYVEARTSRSNTVGHRVITISCLG